MSDRAKRIDEKVFIVAVDFDCTLAEYDHDFKPYVVGEPRPFAIWALQVFKHNKFEVVLHTNRSNNEILWLWVETHAPGLIDYINEHPKSKCRDFNPGKPPADLFIDDRDSRHRGRPVDWVALLSDLLEEGFLPQGYHSEPVE